MGSTIIGFLPVFPPSEPFEYSFVLLAEYSNSYSVTHSSPNHFTKRHLLILHASEQLWTVFKHSPLIALCHPRNLRDLLVCATLTATSHESLGNYPCGVSKCKTCPILMVTYEFFSHTTGKVFKVKFRASCKSSNIIY